MLVKCPSCQNVHVLADRLGWFGEPGSAESFLEAQGQGKHDFLGSDHEAGDRIAERRGVGWFGNDSAEGLPKYC